jgi:hypothetical protein
VPAPARGEHEDRDGIASVAPVAQQRQAVDLRQSKIQHDRIVALGLGEKVRPLAVARAIDRIPGVPQRVGELP